MFQGHADKSLGTVAKSVGEDTRGPEMPVGHVGAEQLPHTSGRTPSLLVRRWAELCILLSHGSVFQQDCVARAGQGFGRVGTGSDPMMSGFRGIGLGVWFGSEPGSSALCDCAPMQSMGRMERPSVDQRLKVRERHVLRLFPRARTNRTSSLRRKSSAERRILT